MARNLAQWLDYQSSVHPKNIELGLERVSAVWQAIAAPQVAPVVVTVAGTNGKGSSLAMLAAMAAAAGYRVGVYTSPHLIRYNERIRIDGQALDDAALCALFERIEQARGEIPLTYFEYGTLAALLACADAKVDLAVLEVGLGGRLDAVNIIDADVALITGIGLDHTDWLGDDLAQIGREKAGIMRAGKPAIVAMPDAPDSVREHAQNLRADLRWAGRDFSHQREAQHWDWKGVNTQRHGLPMPAMRGNIQLQNAAGVLAVFEALEDQLPIDQRAVRCGLLDAQLPGRFQVEQRTCRWVLDVAHNPQAARHLSQQLGEVFVSGEVHAVVGMLSDKALSETLAVLGPRVDHWHLLDLSDQARGASAEALASAVPEGAKVSLTAGPLHETLGETLHALEAQTQADDLVLVFGSFVTVGAVLEWMQI